MQGIILVDKPEGWTSFDAVAYVRKIVAKVENKKPKNVKVGHTGTLDPAATGLLVICVGKYTKKVPELIKKDKTYKVEVTLGKASSTGDKEGEIANISVEKPENSAINGVVKSFIGEIVQTPPIYSAIKVDGIRAYELARKGQKPELKPRKVKVNSLDLTYYEYPIIKLEADVGSGTYIRSLVEDIGKKLGCGAYMSNLRRTKVGAWNITDAIAPKEITEVNINNLLVSKE